MILGIVGSEGAKFTQDTGEIVRTIIRVLVEKHRPTALVSGECHLGGIDIWGNHSRMRKPLPKIIKNSATCTACGVEIVSTHRHDFNAHYCNVEPTPATKWEGEEGNMKIVPDPGKLTFRFAVDGGNEYIRRVGLDGYTDSSVYENE